MNQFNIKPNQLKVINQFLNVSIKSQFKSNSIKRVNTINGGRSISTKKSNVFRIRDQSIFRRKQTSTQSTISRIITDIKQRVHTVDDKSVEDKSQNKGVKPIYFFKNQTRSKIKKIERKRLKFQKQIKNLRNQQTQNSQKTQQLISKRSFENLKKIPIRDSIKIQKPRKSRDRTFWKVEELCPWEKQENDHYQGFI